MTGGAEIEKGERGIVSRLFTWVCVVFCLLALYVLSIGPVDKFVFYGNKKSAPVLEGVYAPLIWAYDNNLIVHRFLTWYVETFWHIEH
jgi:hypothetical protein